MEGDKLVHMSPVSDVSLEMLLLEEAIPTDAFSDWKEEEIRPVKELSLGDIGYELEVEDDGFEGELMGALEEIMDVDSKSMAFRDEEEGVRMERVENVKVEKKKGGSPGRKRKRGDVGLEGRVRKKENRRMNSPEDERNMPVREKCMRCDTMARNTPMMRKGPDGCRSLCNACGLKWSRHGIF